MNRIDSIINELVYSASGRFSACETEQDFTEQRRLYEELLRERIREIVEMDAGEATRLLRGK